MMLAIWAACVPFTVLVGAMVLKRTGESCSIESFAALSVFSLLAWPLMWIGGVLYVMFRFGVWLATPETPKPPRPAFYADDRPNVRIVLPAMGSYRTRMIVTAKGLAFNGQELVDDIKTKITVEEAR